MTVETYTEEESRQAEIPVTKKLPKPSQITVLTVGDVPALERLFDSAVSSD